VNFDDFKPVPTPTDISFSPELLGAVWTIANVLKDKDARAAASWLVLAQGTRCSLEQEARESRRVVLSRLETYGPLARDYYVSEVKRIALRQPGAAVRCRGRDGAERYVIDSCVRNIDQSPSEQERKFWGTIMQGLKTL
jgi:hypothetical protein